jgi:uncharacterized integral membrane protein (TIGR00697 family)
MNILASKQTDIFIFTINLGLFISPIVFIVNDIQSEIFGHKKAKNLILTGLFVNISVAVIYVVAINIPPSKQYHNQGAFNAVLGSTFRMTLASITAYFIGSIINAKVMDYLKKKYSKYLFFRAITSTIFGQLVDNVVFMTLAFAMVLPASSILTMIVGGTIIEVLYEVVFYPLTRMTIKILKINGYEDWEKEFHNA